MPAPKKQSDIPSGVRPPKDLEEVALQIEKKLAGSSLDLFRPISTSLPLLDEKLGGGLHSGDLALLGGVQNIGKTAIALQFAGGIVNDPSVLCIFVCYEHTEQAMFERLITQHSFLSHPSLNYQNPFASADHINRVYMEVIRERDRYQRELSDLTKGTGGDLNFEYINRVIGLLPRGIQAWGMLSTKRSRIWLNTGNSLYTDPTVLRAFINMGVSYGYKRIVLFVDYVQRVPMYMPGVSKLDQMERIDLVLKALKAMALDYANEGVVLAIVGIATADAEALRSGRIHVENLYGDVTTQYEPDIAFIMNKDTLKIDGLDLVRFSIEKNRHGPSDLEWWHKHYGAAYLFDPIGIPVPEEESWQNERKMLLAEIQEMKRVRMWQQASGGFQMSGPLAVATGLVPPGAIQPDASPAVGGS